MIVSHKHKILILDLLTNNEISFEKNIAFLAKKVLFNAYVAFAYTFVKKAYKNLALVFLICIPLSKK